MRTCRLTCRESSGKVEGRLREGWGRFREFMEEAKLAKVRGRLREPAHIELRSVGATQLLVSVRALAAYRVVPLPTAAVERTRLVFSSA